MRQFHYYHKQTGELHSRVFKCDASTPYAERDAKANAPPEHLHLEARIADPSKWRVDVAAKKLVSVK